MTRWVTPEAGRERGPAGLARAWIAVLVRPRAFFRESVAPGDQAPGLAFAVTVVAVEELVRFALVDGSYPVVDGRPMLSGLLWFVVAVVLVAPAALHLAAALQTLLLAPFVAERAGVGETVQVIGYAAAPCVAAGVPVPALRVLATAWGAALLAVGVSEIHGPPLGRAAALTALPAALVFGYGFRGFAAVETLLRQWYII